MAMLTKSIHDEDHVEKRILTPIQNGSKCCFIEITPNPAKDITEERNRTNWDLKEMHEF